MAKLTSISHPLRVDFLPPSSHGLAGQLGMTLAPGRKSQGLIGQWDRDLITDLERLKHHYHCDRLVSLIEDHELVAIGIPTLYEAVRQQGIALSRLAIVDGGTPTDLETYQLLITDLIQALSARETIVIHCHAGLGRTGMLAASILVTKGQPPEAAIAAVRALRPRAIETHAQEQIIYKIAAKI
ncbi:cyclin-dependent kinase inhibitor 3 family protein [Synechococcus elongatus]|uniref:Uncharacterized protein SEC0011 n=2 Tax=Synechococcus elongatus (strain ATCC 33912 / PCC 7942 / FACHB-805) TaxID=1140 RepID=Q8KPU7_SYNE7|nr:cyclin-dependent kinase inhibitor 3 family protein [Synechococcus elongatus]AAM82664.1 unknown [Synechococcus elongatus PCC 7942 = FACHB-805]MBD2588416.1 cyclin-dependent kinase inhibitor 3 family protein [Synechococcus elongatus FACHB-242]MBD2689421.1 cyclin-dependent kinase inhibitor 3 family protein [Synechococcus elongatus FACHB-1061]MBD2708160.1 cyclin-dependent kinase inhibitor 3 family protein [Synechococcus elongatus PCC 7942 = FACHB-805]UOW71398.1 protein phosphatase [Synechococcus